VDLGRPLSTARSFRAAPRLRGSIVAPKTGVRKIPEVLIFADSAA
jgi:hypothetical protein